MAEEEVMEHWTANRGAASALDLLQEGRTLADSCREYDLKQSEVEMLKKALPSVNLRARQAKSFPSGHMRRFHPLTLTLKTLQNRNPPLACKWLRDLIEFVGQTLAPSAWEEDADESVAEER